MPVSYWFEIYDLTFFYKCYSGYYNFPISDSVKPKPITRSTRNSCELDMSVPFCRTKLVQKSYFNRILKLWNNLPPNTRSSSSVSNFKSALCKHYLNALSNSFCPDIYIIFGGPSLPNALPVMTILLLLMSLGTWCVSSIYFLSFDKLFLLFNVE